MDINQFVQKFANQFDETDASVFTPETAFKDLDEWSSLTALSVIAMIDEIYSVNIKGSELEKATTLNELFELIQLKKENG